MSVRCVKIVPNNRIDELLYEKFTSKFRKGWIEVGEEKICMPEYYETIADEIEKFQVHDSDIYLTSHPKTGTTWMQEMIWMIINNLNFEKGKQHLYERIPFIEYQGLIDFTDDELKTERESAPKYFTNSLELSKNCSDNPRVYKTHMPFSLLPKQIRDKTKKPKIIHVIRNAKDTCVSYYHHCRILEGYKGDLEEFCQLFKAGRLSWGPFWTNILGYWNNQKDYNILIVKYEDMKKDLASVIRKVSNYLEKSLNDEQVKMLEEHLSFKNMKKNSSVNFENHCEFAKKVTNVDGTFMRSGKVGTYREELSQETINDFDTWTRKTLAETGLNYDE